MARFEVGQIVKHLKFGYRGVVFGVDPEFALSADWYEAVARSRPPRDQPWYHVMVDGARHTTYVAERHLIESADRSQVAHPQLGDWFESYDGTRYRMRTVH
jgi:heat shock protein HspQ